MAQFEKEQTDEGEFKRQADAFRDWVSDDEAAAHPVENSRYHLYVSLACPWAHRTLIVRKLLGLENAIGATIVNPIRDGRGWCFEGGDFQDPINGFHFLQEAYVASHSNFDGRVTVPVLWDIKKRKIVNNSEDDICRMLSGVFRRFASSPYDFFPDQIATEQKALSEYIYENINNGVYRAGFATSQKVYASAAEQVFAALDKMDERLAKQRFLFGAQFVESDWRLFCTLIRFDAVYHGHFKCNVRRILDYPNLSGYLRDLYQWPGVRDTVNFDHIKSHYYYTHDDINPTRIIPIGPDFSHLMTPSYREKL